MSNGTVVGATSTYTVPATAKTGDIITVTVTSENEETATDSVIVSGLTITGVEPTPAAGTNGAGNLIGYKYLRIFFSEPLSSLDSSEIEIRDVKSKQLYSLESVKLSSTGLFADVILYGSDDADGTTLRRLGSFWSNTENEWGRGFGGCCENAVSTTLLVQVRGNTLYCDESACKMVYVVVDGRMRDYILR